MEIPGFDLEALHRLVLRAEVDRCSSSAGIHRQAPGVRVEKKTAKKSKKSRAA
ncbi:hypothetical protein ABIF63_004867 [Bradyrhizobium japonicum]|uniref:Transposase n=1 Tax=Bradyrhizobium japonicum TaxID=375 RepID=A0ABV2RV22_BRAJP|nr:hypothetical protein [Bradyrhizobium japonicum]UQD96021.1 hypothetical protein JEY30_31235 [Bradyrhizobium japonicum]WLB16158.1 hypothetical protein QIH95_29440 [Bradyrhizobium japonicum]